MEQGRGTGDLKEGKVAALMADLLADYGDRPLFHTMERLMLEEPGHWADHYSGSDAQKRTLRHYSLSDRIRYYWSNETARAAAARLTEALRGEKIPLPLLLQHLPCASGFAEAPLDIEDLLIWRVAQSISTYHAACNPQTGER